MEEVHVLMLMAGQRSHRTPEARSIRAPSGRREERDLWAMEPVPSEQPEWVAR
jgi:hypothetical protein